MDALFQDLRYALRTLTRSLASTTIVVVTLALAMGTSAVMFTVAEAVLQSVPARDRSRVVSIAATDPQHGRPRLQASVPEFADWRARSRSFESIGAMTFTTANLTDVTTPMRLRIVRASADFFPTLGVQAGQGRLFTADEDRPGRDRVALLTEDFWRRQFDAHRSVIGRPLTLDGSVHTIVGVLPASVSVGALRQQDVWIPLAADPARAPRERRVLYVLGRLKAGVTSAQSGAEMSGIARQLEREFPVTNTGVGIAVDPAIEAFGGRGNIRFVIGLLMLMAALLVWIACANVANVVLARATTRRRELAVRSAIGASRLRIVRQLLVEDIVLSVAGGAAGLLLCAWEVDAVKAFAGGDMVILSDLSVDAQVLLFAIAVGLAAPIVFGLLPALRASVPDLRGGLKDGSRGATAGARGGRLRGALVACQVALAIALLIEVGFMVRAVRAISTIDQGMNPHNLLTLRVDLPEATYATSQRVRDFYAALTLRVGAIPGVQSAGAINWLPIVNRERPVRFLVDGRPAPSPGEEAWAGLANVTPAYRRTMEIPLVGGRDLTADDSADERPVALISREAARRYWGAADPIGRHIRFLDPSREPETDNREPEIVGIVGDVWTGNRDAPVIPMIYVPQTQAPQHAMALVVRAPGDAATLANAVRNRVQEIDKDQPVYDVKTMDRHLYEDRADMYIVVTMLVALAGIALGLAAAGLYGVVAYVVGQRTHEIGVRMALGAESGVVQRMIVAQALVPVVIGAAAGLAMGFGLVQTTAVAMREVSPRSPAVYLAVSAVVGMVALAASYFPARRATRVDPLLALRAE